MKVTILGCGTSAGVPRIGNVWGRCDPANPKNRRRRVSVMVEEGATRVLVDTSPDLRAQLLDAGVGRLDAVFYTHEHADHCHGIDDLRPVAQNMKARIPLYAGARTMAVLRRRFDYIFEMRDGYPPVGEGHILRHGCPVPVGGLTVLPFLLEHGPIDSFGFRFGRAAYTTDLNGIPQASAAFLEDLDLWIVDALRYDPHPTHPHLEQSLAWIARFRPKRAILTHMNWDLDYETLRTSLPAGVEPAYDGLAVELAPS
ncbi:MAG: MBL fold metallo-hydrolase [Alphaproteobacteria bacterium]|nr:MAG: MBL fold metallo-hydrolase [Alphaproteobacteria bacterium]